MSVTIEQQPQDYNPVSSPLIYIGLSNQVAQPNFKYTVIVTDVISSETQTYPIDPDPDNYCRFDAKPFMEPYISRLHTIPQNEYGWKVHDGIRQVKVNIGETYGSSPAYASGTDLTHICWNAILSYLDYPIFNYTDFVSEAGTTPVIKILNDTTFNDVTFEDKSYMLYWLCKGTSSGMSANIITYDVLGNVVSTSQIDYSAFASTNYRDKYICIDVGHKGLSQIDPSDVTGDYPIITDEVAYYEVSVGMIGSFASSNLAYKTLTIKCEPRFEPYVLHYLKKNGAFQTISFGKKSEVEISKTSEKYSRSPWVMNSGDYTYDPSTPIERVINSESRRRIKLNTDWLTEEAIESHKDIIDSPIVYLDRGSELSYVALNVVTNSYQINRRYNSRMLSLEMEFEYAHTDGRQMT